MDTLAVLNVLDKYGFEPQRVAMVLRKYHDFIVRHFPQNTKKFLFFGRQNMQPTKYEGMKTRLQTCSKTSYGRVLAIAFNKGSRCGLRL